MSESAIEVMADWLEKAIEQTHGYRSTNRAKYVELAKLLPAAVGTALAEDDAAVEKVARALCVDDAVDPDAVGYDRTGRDLPNWYVVQGTALAAIRALGE